MAFETVNNFFAVHYLVLVYIRKVEKTQRPGCSVVIIRSEHARECPAHARECSAHARECPAHARECFAHAREQNIHAHARNIHVHARDIHAHACAEGALYFEALNVIGSLRTMRGRDRDWTEVQCEI